MQDKGMFERLVSVLMPAYNAEKYIEDAIKSILYQSYTNFEFLIINDGSIDNTENLILSFNDPRIVYVKNDRNLKLIATLNKGVEMSRGEIIVRMDADDIALPDMILNAVRGFDDAPYASVVNQLDYEMNDSGTKYWKRYFFKQLGTDTLRFTQQFSTQILHPGVAIKTDVLKKYMYSTEPVALHREDAVLWQTLLNDGHYIKVLSSYALYHRRAEGSITGTSHSKNFAIKDSLKRILDSSPVKFDDDSLNWLCYSELRYPWDIVNVNKVLRHYFRTVSELHHLRKGLLSELYDWSDFFVFYNSLQNLKKRSYIYFLAFILLCLFQPSIWTHKDIYIDMFRLLTHYDRKKMK